MIDFIAYWLVKITGKIFNILPINFALGIARVIGWLLAFTQIRVAQAYANIKMAFPGRFSGPEIRSIIRSNYMNMTQNLVEMFRFPKMTRQFAESYVKIPHVSRFFECKKAGKGTILLTAHFGNWEYLNIRSCFLGIPIFVLVRDQKFPRLNCFLTKLRESHGSTMVGKGAELRQIIKAVHENEMIGFLGDQQGGKSGVPVRFFGRMTTAPAGPIQIPLRTGAKVLPCFIVREHGPYHTVHVEPEMALEKTGDEDRDVQINTQNYISILERYIYQYPDQWHWLHKRWKHNWTKRVVLLSDGKAGHESQSRAIFELLKTLEDSDSRYTFQLQEIQVKYKNDFFRKIFPLVSFLFMPFIQGRIHWFRSWFQEESFRKLEHAAADIIISCGSSVLPLNYVLKRECLAKNIVIMKPGLPFSLFKSDLNLVPEHDDIKETEKVIFTRVAPNLVDPEKLKLQGEGLRQELNLNHNRVVSVFLGGKTKKYNFEEKLFEQFLGELDKSMERNNFDLLLTTSRRTEPKFENQIKNKYAQNKRVPLMVIANEKNPEGAVPKMMGSSDVLVVSEDSVSMISEGVASGKSVVVLRLAKKGLAKKHYRFQKKLESQSILRIANPSNLKEILEEELNHRKTRVIVDDTKKIMERLESLL